MPNSSCILLANDIISLTLKSNNFSIDSLNLVVTWFSINKLKFNVSKTQKLNFTSDKLYVKTNMVVCVTGNRCNSQFELRRLC